MSAVAARATAAAGRPAGTVLGESVRLELREDEGVFALKVKANVPGDGLPDDGRAARRRRRR